MKTFDQLITEAQAALDSIAAHPDFDTLLEQSWDNAEIGISDCVTVLNHLQTAYTKMQSSTALDDCLDNLEEAA